MASTTRIAAIVTLAVLSSINFLDSYSRYLISVALLPYVNYASYEYSLLSGALFSVIYAAGGVAIALHRQMNEHIVVALTAATLLFSVAFFCTGFTQNFWQLALIRIVMGFGQSVFTPYSTKILGSLFGDAYRGLVFGIFNFTIYLAFACVLSVGTYMYDEYGWQAGYQLFGVLGFFLGLLVPFTVVETPALHLDWSNSRVAYSCNGSVDRDSKTLRPSFLNGYRQISASDESAFLSSIVSDSLMSAYDGGLEAETSPGPGPGPLCPRGEEPPPPAAATEPAESRHKSSAGSEVTTDSSESAAPALTSSQSLRALYVFWRANPSLTLLTLAMGVRLGGGYIWGAYTAVYFSELYIDNDDSCSLSYNASSLDIAGSCTDSAYRYCIDELCKDISQTPFHNEGKMLELCFLFL
jgi:MFS family permease